MPTHLSLFSGIGGLDLAAEWAGFETVGQCEWADYPTKVLEKHWPNVPRWRDIKTLTGDDFYQKTGLRTVDVISGGFPCQPFSSAGQQKGEADDRFLWPEMLRVIEELNPAWVLGENVDGLLSAKFDETLKNIIGGLEAAGYYVRVFSFEAAQVGAWQRRRRTFIVANAESERLQGRTRKQQGAPNPRFGQNSADRQFKRRTTQPGLGRVANGISCWLDEPAGVPRVAVGVKDRVSRIKGLGNAVVPKQAYPIFAAIYDLLEGIS